MQRVNDNNNMITYIITYVNEEIEVLARKRQHVVKRNKIIQR